MLKLAKQGDRHVLGKCFNREERERIGLGNIN